MLNLIQNQLTDILASARSAIQSIESMLMHRSQPAMVPVPVNGRRRQVSSVSCDHGYEAIIAGAVPTQADLVTNGWRSLDFGPTTKTGNNRHSQPSRFAT